MGHLCGSSETQLLPECIVKTGLRLPSFLLDCRVIFEHSEEESTMYAIMLNRLSIVYSVLADILCCHSNPRM